MVFEHERAIGDLEAAWQTIEAAAAFFGLGVWLKQEQPVNLDESSWVRPLLERCNSVPWLLVPFYLHDASDEELKLCHRLTIAEVTRTFGPGRKVELFRLACEGHVLPDPALVEAVVELARFAQIELDAAVPARQERRAAAAIRIGAAALDVFSRLCDDSVEG